MKSIATMMACLSADQLEAITKLSRQINECLETTVMPQSVQDAIRLDWQRLGAERRYAVRSSATVEDGKTWSFAGQFESTLDVQGMEGLIIAIKSCWLSLYSERALIYQAKRGILGTKSSMSVLVQELIPADCSGVIFTADPLTGMTNQMLVECVSGLGETLMQGHIRPETIWLDRTRQLDATQYSADKSPKRILSGPDLLHLLDLGTRVEHLFGGPQDIEWAICGGKVFLLQSRPITTQAHVVKDGEAVWSNLNVIENLQNVVTPMAWSFLHSCFRQIADPLIRGMEIDPEKNPWMGLIAGRVYMNVSTVRRILLNIPGFQASSLSHLLGGYQDAIAPMSKTRESASLGNLSFCTRLRRKAQVLRYILTRITWRSRKTCRAQLIKSRDLFLNVDYRQLSDDQLTAHLNGLLNFGYTGFKLPAVLGLGLGTSEVLRQCSKKWLGDADGNLANRLLSRAGGMASAEAALDVWRLAVWLEKREPLRQMVLAHHRFDELSVALPSINEGLDFLLKWKTLMAQHGHRGRGEADLGAPRWSETPDEVLHMLQHYLNSTGQLDLLQILHQRTLERDHLLAETLARFKNPLRRWAFGFLVRQAQAGIVYRENIKSDLVRVVAYVRALMLDWGERMTRSGMLDTRDDIFFLTLDEIELARKGDASINTRSMIIARREEFRQNQTLTPPSIVVGEFDPALMTHPIADPNATVLHGMPVSSGVVTGRARVILSADTHEKVLPGEILIAPYTDPGWTPHFLTAAGLVVDLGGQLSHGSVVAREYGLPAVVNAQFATQIIRTGQLLRVDGNLGVVVLLPEPN